MIIVYSCVLSIRVGEEALAKKLCSLIYMTPPFDKCSRWCPASEPGFFVSGAKMAVTYMQAMVDLLFGDALQELADEQGGLTPGSERLDGFDEHAPCGSIREGAVGNKGVDEAGNQDGACG